MDNKQMRLCLINLVEKYIKTKKIENVDLIDDLEIKNIVFCLNNMLKNNQITDAYKFIAQL